MLLAFDDTIDDACTSVFISSDYLLQQLGIDPRQTQQRLGDGFYEQQQVLAQITDLTGRRYLADDTYALRRAVIHLSPSYVSGSFSISCKSAAPPASIAGGAATRLQE